MKPGTKAAAAPRAGRQEQQVHISRFYAHPRERVFAAFGDAEWLKRWFAPHNCALQVARFEFRPGAPFHMCIHDPQFGECWTVGEYLEIVRPERIVWSLATADAMGNVVEPADAGHDPAWPRQTIVAVTLVEREGGTLLTLTQDVAEAIAQRTGALPSWREMLERLDATLTRRGSGGNG